MQNTDIRPLLERFDCIKNTSDEIQTQTNITGNLVQKIIDNIPPYLTLASIIKRLIKSKEGDDIMSLLAKLQPNDRPVFSDFNLMSRIATFLDPRQYISSLVDDAQSTALSYIDRCLDANALIDASSPMTSRQLEAISCRIFHDETHATLTVQYTKAPSAKTKAIPK